MDKHKYSTGTSDHSSYLCTDKLMDVIPMKTAVNEVHTAFPPHTQKQTPIKKKKTTKNSTQSQHTLSLQMIHT